MPRRRRTLIDLLTAPISSAADSARAFSSGRIATRLPRRYLANCVRPVGGPSIPVQPPSTNNVLPLT